MHGASARIRAARDDCPFAASRALDALATAAERAAELDVTAAMLVCADMASCPRALLCRQMAEAALDRLWPDYG